MSSTDKERCYVEIERCWRYAEKEYGADLWDTSIEWSNRMTSCAGRAFYGSPYKILLSTQILKSNPELFISRTPAHEAAHIIVHAVFNEKGHGHLWKSVCMGLKIEPKRCHSYKFPIKRQKRYAMYCGCTTHLMTQVKVNRIRENITVYRCKKCKKPIGEVAYWTIT